MCVCVCVCVYMCVHLCMSVCLRVVYVHMCPSVVTKEGQVGLECSSFTRIV